MIDEKILKKYTRNLDVEQYAFDEFAKKTSSNIGRSEIANTIRKNRYNGLYLFEPEDFYEIERNTSVSGIYNNEHRVIILNKEDFEFENDIAIHELVHAYLNRRSQAIIKIDDKVVEYGVGLEEGIASLIQKTNCIDDIDDCVVSAYPCQACLFKQLNVLYQYSDYKKHSNLMCHLLKEPNDFLHAISGIYKSVFRKIFGDHKEILNLSLRCAYVIVSATDVITDNDDVNHRYFYQIASICNSICLAFADPNIRNGRTENALFPQLSKVIKSSEEKLMSAIFNDESAYFNGKTETLMKMLMLCLEELEKVENDINLSENKIKNKQI